MEVLDDGCGLVADAKGLPQLSTQRGTDALELIVCAALVAVGIRIEGEGAALRGLELPDMEAAHKDLAELGAKEIGIRETGARKAKGAGREDRTKDAGLKIGAWPRVDLLFVRHAVALFMAERLKFARSDCIEDGIGIPLLILH